jgi:hypothetical protein
MSRVKGIKGKKPRRKAVEVTPKTSPSRTQSQSLNQSKISLLLSNQIHFLCVLVSLYLHTVFVTCAMASFSRPKLFC